MVRWRPMGPHLGYRTLYRKGDLALRLLRGSPGSDVGSHSHRGQEFTLVLKGGFSDETGAYGPGDFQCADDGVTHNPVADPGEDCINLAVTIGGLRFGSAAQNLVARLFGF
jgi:putative transcriptional regulator